MFTIHAMVGKRRNPINMPRLYAYGTTYRQGQQGTGVPDMGDDRTIAQTTLLGTARQCRCGHAAVRQPTWPTAYAIRRTLPPAESPGQGGNSVPNPKRQIDTPALHQTHHGHSFAQGRRRLRQHQSMARPCKSEYDHGLRTRRSGPEATGPAAGIPRRISATEGWKLDPWPHQLGGLASAPLKIMWSSRRPRAQCGRSRLHITNRSP